MKVTLAFLFLGICLALTNARSVARRKMSEAEAYSHGRLMALVMKRWNDWQNCHRCSDAERYCMEKAIVEDTCFMMRMMSNDMGYTLQQFLGRVNFQIQVTVVIKAMDHDDMDTLTKTLRAHGMITNFVQTVFGLMNDPLKDCNVDIGGILGSVNGLLNGGINGAMGLVGGLTNVAHGIVGGLTNTLDLTNSLGGLTNSLGGLTNNLDGLTNTVGGITGAAGGLVGGLTNAATGAVGGLANAATGAVGGLANAATGVLGGVTNAVGGVLGGLLGGLGGKKG